MPEGLTIVNNQDNGFDLSWPSVPGEDILYQVTMKKVGSFRPIPKTIYKGPGVRYIINNLEYGAEYEFHVKCKYGSSWGTLCDKVVKRVEKPSQQPQPQPQPKPQSQSQSSQQPPAQKFQGGQPRLLQQMKEMEHLPQSEIKPKIQASINTLKNNSGDAAACEEALNFLSISTLNGKNNDTRSSFLEIFSFFPSLLSHILLNNVDDSIDEIGRSGAIGPVINVMKTHIDSVPICRTGCFILFKLTETKGKQRRQHTLFG